MYFLNINKSGSNTSAIAVYNKRSRLGIEVRQCNYLNNIAEQDHMYLVRIVQRLGFKEFESARRTINGFGLIHLIRKNQFTIQDRSRYRTFCKMLA